MDRIRVGCLDILVHFADLEDCFGIYESSPKPKITLDRSTEHPCRAMTMVHEFLHAVSDIYDINLTEHEVRLLETGLCQFMRDNPQACLEILQGIQQHGQG